MSSGPDTATQFGPWRWLLRVGTVLILMAAVEYGVLPRLAGAERIMRLLTTVNPWWVTAAVGLEALSLVSYSQLSLQIIDVRGKGLWWMMRTDLSGLAVSHLLPAGAAAGNAVRYRLLRGAGISVEDASAGVTLEGIGSLLALLAVLWASLGAAALRYGPGPIYVIPIVIGAVVTGLSVLMHRYAHVSRLGAQARAALMVVTPRRVRTKILVVSGTFVADARRLLTDRAYLWNCARWAVAYWCLDAASLWCFLAAFNVYLDPVGTLVAYAVANAVGSLPLTPGGLGLVEGSLIPALIAFGAPPEAALLGALGWRLVEFWGPIPLGGIAYLNLRAQDRFGSLPDSRNPDETGPGSGGPASDDHRLKG